MLIDYYHFEGSSHSVPVNLPFARDKPFLDLVAGDAILSFGSTRVGETLKLRSFSHRPEVLVSRRRSKALCSQMSRAAAECGHGRSRKRASCIKMGPQNVYTL